MDGIEHNHRPWKKIRFEKSFECERISLRSFQPNEDRDHCVHTQAPTTLNLEEAQNSNPVALMRETYHHLNVDHQYAQCAELNHQSTTTSRSNISSSSSASSAAAGILPECNYEPSFEKSPDQVCFGMVGLPPWRALRVTVLENYY